VGAVPWGTHFCQFYETGQDLVDTLVPYFLAGLAANEFCMWVTAEPLRVEEAAAALRQALPDLDRFLAKGQIEILDYSEWYTRSGKFDAGTVLKGWLDKLAAALELGYEGLRLTGNTSWLDEAAWGDFRRYEEMVDDVMGQHRLLALCTYSLEKCDAREILDVISNHQFALIKSADRWEIIGSARYRKPELALWQSERRLRLAADVAGLGVFEWDVLADRPLWANRRMFEILGRDPQDGPLTKAQFVAEVIHPDDAGPLEAALAEGMRTGRRVVVPCRIRRCDDGAPCWVELSGHFERGADASSLRGIGVMRDVTETRAREDELGKLNRTLRALSTSNQALLRAADETEFLQAVCRIVVEDCGHAMAWIGYAEEDEGKTVRPVASAGFEDGELETLKTTWSDSEVGRDPAGTAIRTGKASRCRNLLADPAFAPWREEALRRGHASSVALPLLSGGKAFGAVTIYSRQPDAFSDEEVGLLSELANDLAYGIETIRLRVAHQQSEEALARSEARYRALFNGMTEGFAVHEIVTDEKGEPCDTRFLDVNPAFERLTGLRREDVVGRRFSQVLPDEDPHWVRAFGAVALTGEPVHFENYAPVLKRHYEVFAYRPAPRQCAVIFMDITARKQEEQLSQAIDSVNEVIHSTLDADEILQRVIGKAAGALGCDTAAISLRSQNRWVVRHGHGLPPGVIGAEMNDEEEPHALLAIRTKAPVAIDDAFDDPRVNREHMRQWGIRSVLVVPILSRVEAVGVLFFNYQRSAVTFAERHVDFAKKLAASLALALENSRLYEDVRWELAERKQTEEAVRSAALFPEQNPSPVLRVARDGSLLYANPVSAPLLTQWRCRVGGSVPARVLETVQAALAQGVPQEMELTDDGRDISLVVSPVADRGYANLYGYNITERKRAENALRESEERYRALVELAPEAVLVHQEGCYVYANPAGLRLFGAGSPDQLLGRRVLDLVHPEEREMIAERIRAVARGESVPVREIRLQRLDGTMLLVESAAVRVDFQGRPALQVIVRDVTERRRLEERLAHAQKMEAIGLLAGGVAHDFNNLLVGVIGNASLAQETLPPDSQALPLLDRVIKAGENAAYLTRQLLAYAGKGQVVMEPLDLSRLVREGADLMRSSISSKVRLHLDLAADLPPVRVDRGQAQQVFMNLVLNAAEAIGSGPGLISVRTLVRSPDERALRGVTGAELRPGSYVCLEVADNGSGMDEETRAKIFDPFFTTKFLGRGLGLAAVGGIVRSHGGAIQLESEPGKGSRFTILLPVVEGEVAAAGGAPAARDLRGAGTILLVDDEEIVLEMAKSALERHGYEVLVAPSGPEAVKLFQREAARIALVILDLSMPGMGGEEVLPELQRIHRDVRVVVSSGYSQDEAMKHFRGLPAAGFIQKPYTAARLAAEVQRAFD